jgi:hypothetical protein
MHYGPVGAQYRNLLRTQMRRTAAFAALVGF